MGRAGTSLSVRVQRWHVGRDAVVLQHMEQSRLPSIVQTLAAQQLSSLGVQWTSKGVEWR